jgi:hypothetical protein
LGPLEQAMLVKGCICGQDFIVLSCAIMSPLLSRVVVNRTQFFILFGSPTLHFIHSSPAPGTWHAWVSLYPQTMFLFFLFSFCVVLFLTHVHSEFASLPLEGKTVVFFFFGGEAILRHVPLMTRVFLYLPPPFCPSVHSIPLFNAKVCCWHTCTPLWKMESGLFLCHTKENLCERLDSDWGGVGVAKWKANKRYRRGDLPLAPGIACLLCPVPTGPTVPLQVRPRWYGPPPRCPILPWSCS